MKNNSFYVELIYSVLLVPLCSIVQYCALLLKFVIPSVLTVKNNAIKNNFPLND